MSIIKGFTEEDIKKLKESELASYEFYTKEDTASALRFWINKVNQYFYGRHQALKEEMQKIRKKGDYTEKKIAEIHHEKLKAIEDEAISMRERLRMEMFSYLAKKKVSADKMLVAVPTEEQATLLDMIEKNKHIPNEELSVIINSFKTNYVAIKTLQGMLKDRNIIITLPRAYDYNEILKSIDFTEKYVDKVLAEIGKPREKQNMEVRPFLWNREENAEQWIDNAYLENVENVLDVNLQMLDKIQLLSIDELDDMEKAKFYDVLNEKDINKVVDKINTLENEKDDYPWNGNVLKVLSMHPDFAPYISDENKAQPNQE